MLYSNAHAQLQTLQTICYIKYSYDAAGNRTGRSYECGANPAYLAPGTSNNNTGGGSLRPSVETNSSSLSNIIVFPNPSKGIFYIKPEALQEEMQYLITVRDMHGKMILKKHVTDIMQGIDIKHVSNGEYLIEISQGSAQHILKLLKTD